MQWKPAYALLLLGVTAVTYLGARALDNADRATGLNLASKAESKPADGTRRKALVWTFAVLALLPLLVFKYYNFVNDNVREVLRAVGFAAEMPGLNWAVPIGISFFTFQAVGYLLDVYHRRIEAERDWWDYMLFICFFPQVMSGPISKAKDLLPQLKRPWVFDYHQVVEGCKALLWGMFLKVVMADRLGIYVDTVFGNWQYCTGTSCLAASFAYTMQIYGDFAGYSLMAVGVGKLLGIELVQNFRRPYLAVSITDFWRRWHISLSTWLKDYVYIPLGGSRCSKGRSYLNIFITFLVSGIWHGANWTFIVWGVLHGLLQIVEKALGLQRCESSHWWVRAIRISITFALVNLLWTVFRMPTIGDAAGMIAKMLTQGGAILSPGNKEMLYFAMAISMVVCTEIMEEFFPNRMQLMHNRHAVVRWATYLILIGLIMLTGVFDSSQFIYVNF